MNLDHKNIHICKTGIIIVMIPWANWTENGYCDKYLKIANNLVDRKIATVIRSSHPIHTNYPDSMITFVKELIQKIQLQAEELSGKKDPLIYLMGYSAGAWVVASVCWEFLAIKKILLIAPAIDVWVENIRKWLSSYTGEIYITLGDDDKVVGKYAWEAFLSEAIVASKKEFISIPHCDHQFSGIENWKILSKAPIWAFVGDSTFPHSIWWIELYS